MPKIEELWAWVIEDSDPDDEGVPAYLGVDGAWYPLIGADRHRALSLRGEAQKTADLTGKRLVLRRSVGLLETVETVQPTTGSVSE